MYLDLCSLGAETRVGHSSMLDAGDVCERERGALAAPSSASADTDCV
jgi:hypothetical protein